MDVAMEEKGGRLLRTGAGDARWLTRAAANAVAVERAVPEAKGYLTRQVAPQAKQERHL